mmetsp:Transcript_74129/g.206033  ORF Transcript_74129/g.206033 Transcript_74129/m.206033 type:complete len:349 (+) Transcript_74129:325-1371(+)
MVLVEEVLAQTICHVVPAPAVRSLPVETHGVIVDVLARIIDLRIHVRVAHERPGWQARDHVVPVCNTESWDWASEPQVVSLGPLCVPNSWGSKTVAQQHVVALRLQVEHPDGSDARTKRLACENNRAVGVARLAIQIVEGTDDVLLHREPSTMESGVDPAANALFREVRRFCGEVQIQDPVLRIHRSAHGNETTEGRRPWRRDVDGLRGRDALVTTRQKCLRRVALAGILDRPFFAAHVPRAAHVAIPADVAALPVAIHACVQDRDRARRVWHRSNASVVRLACKILNALALDGVTWVDDSAARVAHTTPSAIAALLTTVVPAKLPLVLQRFRWAWLKVRVNSVELCG